MKPRKPLTQSQKKELLKRQGGLCAVKSCRVELKPGRFEDDHHQARIFSGGEELANRRLICKRCHLQKTKTEQKGQRARQADQIRQSAEGPADARLPQFAVQEAHGWAGEFPMMTEQQIEERLRLHILNISLAAISKRDGALTQCKKLLVAEVEKMLRETAAAS